MKILLLSDTHGDLSRVFKISKRLTGIDLILHCGDYQHDAFDLEDFLGIPVISVKGNCDGNTREDKEIVETPYGKILLTHGNWEHVNFKYDNLLYAAEEKDCFAVCFGHTHIACAEEIGGIHLINPGSLTDPRDGSGGTYAILRCMEDDFHANIVHYERIFGCGAEDSSDGGNSKSRDDESHGGSNGGSGNRDDGSNSGNGDDNGNGNRNSSDGDDGGSGNRNSSDGDDGGSGNRNSSSKHGSNNSNGNGKSGSKVRGGFLRNLLNYSDRF